MQKSMCSQTDVIKAKTGTMESCMMGCSTWNLKQHRRRHRTKRNWNHEPTGEGFVFLVWGWEGAEFPTEPLKCWCFQASRESTRSMNTKVHRWLSLAPARLATQNARTKQQWETAQVSCRSTLIKLLNLRRSQVDLLPSSGKGWKSRSSLWQN